MIRKTAPCIDAIISLIGILLMMVFWGLAGSHGCPFLW